MCPGIIHLFTRDVRTEILSVEHSGVEEGSESNRYLMNINVKVLVTSQSTED